ncbi:FMN-binding protein [Luteimicrobium subarcticum]|uniref:FMN-binding protein n=1 Tax=Luteimicrobium subarcticum TaxID=620910 RepID=A0A2M8WT87_9MICO|nr:FMN-binding protein [Luteimicrobium subarcticum]PJI94150.1 FMN-binding protein [Luteimicrobium subarcticum]
MRRITLWALSTVTVLLLLLSYHTSTSSRTSLGAESSEVAQGAPDDVGGSSSGGSSSGGSSSGGSSSTATGDVTQTRWGPVQVEITVADGEVTAVDVLQQPDGNGRDQQINAYAIPVLKQETLSAQSADVDMVSGATVTSDGYVQSLQSALDKAGL